MLVFFDSPQMSHPPRSGASKRPVSPPTGILEVVIISTVLSSMQLSVGASYSFFFIVSLM